MSKKPALSVDHLVFIKQRRDSCTSASPTMTELPSPTTPLNPMNISFLLDDETSQEIQPAEQQAPAGGPLRKTGVLYIKPRPRSRPTSKKTSPPCTTAQQMNQFRAIQVVTSESAQPQFTISINNTPLQAPPLSSALRQHDHPSTTARINVAGPFIEKVFKCSIGDCNRDFRRYHDLMRHLNSFTHR
ncbi:hypothetical protein BCR33DRAFT_827580 [Rhizoclosmatium globosum]|uniref:C2H2-type domain-containing protein n=1 Tax=Rhizoclosmatium globosum TaxID=329046 RepID=A0A1Y2C152_9FUNG|nr:hypothetical protein BCR33DRAFT_827580 [Rhizoclosmatium globosum]|eukprot:ORY40750.1 hypothetical protein BCR33DRAFT_827580 [Rhizoclosmatium globosum]